METDVVGGVSEVACLMAQMAEEYEAAVLGLTGLAQGTGRHAFISTKMENMGKLGQKIEDLGGDGLALVIDYIGKLADKK